MLTKLQLSLLFSDIALFKDIVQANLAMMTRYLPGIAKVGLENASPKAVVEALEEG